MKDRLLEIAAQLAQPETAARREAVLHFLSRAGISHEVRTGHAKPDPGGFALFTQSVPKTEVEVQNIIVRPLDNDGPKLVIGAHYDAFPGSPGANDNASGMADAIRRWSLCFSTRRNQAAQARLPILPSVLPTKLQAW